MEKMKSLIFVVLCTAWTFADAQQDYPIQAIPFTAVKLADSFWLPRIETNRTVTIPASFEQCRMTGRIKNFEMAAARSGTFSTVYPFDDTDIYKTLEGASYSLATHPDKTLEAYLDSLIVLIGKAQETDGYLFTPRAMNPGKVASWIGNNRWEKEHDNSHELYNAGHLYEAAVAHYMATGKKNLLNIALKNADLLLTVFGPGKMQVAPGHEVVEMGLVKLYRVTGKKDYLDLAKFFIEQRGERKYNPKSKNPWENGNYWQAHKPVVEQAEVTGHAVRAMYLYAAVADIAALTGDTAYLNAADRLWDNMATKKIYIHGGIGAIGDGERFGENYELPNLTAYAETCAAIGNVYWNHRMFLLHGDAKYMDMLEKTLYNGLISGAGLDGKSFFYTNAMQIRNSFTHKDQERARVGWFTCSCCPTNVTRLVPSVPGYIYARRGNDLYVNLFVAGATSIALDNKNNVKIQQINNYPWQGDLLIKVDPQKAAEFNLLVRIPGWTRGEASPGNLYHFSNKKFAEPVIKVNGKEFPYALEKGFAVIKRKWQKNDRVELSLPMEIQTVMADTSVKEDVGKIALQRGPIVYCAEGIDNGGKSSNLVVPANQNFSARYEPQLLNGMVTITGAANSLVVDEKTSSVSTRPTSFKAIPYYAWANREKSEMTIWFPYLIRDVDVITKE
jgi:DUF1680 family protein